MPGYVSLVSQISTDVVAALAAASQPPLVDGKILLGRQHIAEHSSPPRIVFIPKSSTFPAPATASRSSGNAAEQAAQRNARSLRAEWKTFEVHCWGLASTPDRDGDYDATETLYQQVIRSVHLLCPGIYVVESGAWTDETLVATEGREFVFDLTIKTPVLDRILEQVPPGTVGQIDVSLQPANGDPPELDVTITT